MKPNALYIPLVIGMLAWVMIFFDWLGRRRDRQKRERPT